MGQTIAESIWEDGRLKGLVEGESKGELRASRQLLREVLADRFGELPETVMQRIERADDFDRLSAAVVAAPRFATLDDLQL